MAFWRGERAQKAKLNRASFRLYMTFDAFHTLGNCTFEYIVQRLSEVCHYIRALTLIGRLKLYMLLINNMKGKDKGQDEIIM